jgi:ribosomal protein S18 acetylase RimI-like enzyme
MTDSSYDLYWIVAHSAARGKGVAGALIGAMEADLAGRNATGIRIETSQLESYGAARRVYDRHEYAEVGRIPDFYREGDALVTFYKRL